jgi:hypothetical protein
LYKYGLHVHQGSPNAALVQGRLLAMARTGKLAGATVINNFDLANALFRAGVSYVVHRTVSGVGDAQPGLTGIYSEEQLGRNWWHNGPNQDAHAHLDSGVYIQPYGANEQDAAEVDGYFTLGMMKAATEQGRKLAVFGDSVGTPDMRQLPDGTWTSIGWLHRSKSGCMAYGKQHGHLACVHDYGRMVNVKETEDPGSEIFPDGHTDEGAWQWFGGGRHYTAWTQILPPESRMNLFIGECGASAANLHGADFIGDFKNYQARFAKDPYVVAFCYWTVGGQGPYGFGYSSLDDDLPAVMALLGV